MHALWLLLGTNTGNLDRLFLSGSQAWPHLLNSELSIVRAYRQVNTFQTTSRLQSKKCKKCRPYKVRGVFSRLFLCERRRGLAHLLPTKASYSQPQQLPCALTWRVTPTHLPLSDLPLLTLSASIFWKCVVTTDDMRPKSDNQFFCNHWWLTSHSIVTWTICSINLLWAPWGGLGSQ